MNRKDFFLLGVLFVLLLVLVPLVSAKTALPPLKPRVHFITCTGVGPNPAQTVPTATVGYRTPTPVADAGEVELTAADDGTTVDLKQGQKLVVTLESNPINGYGWFVDPPLDGNVLTQDGEAVYDPEAGTQTFRFTAADPGAVHLDMLYERAVPNPNESGDAYIVETGDTFRVTVRVNN
jgi:predicted secreted protein